MIDGTIHIQPMVEMEAELRNVEAALAPWLANCSASLV